MEHSTREHLNYTFSTWVFDLHIANIHAENSDVARACQGIQDADDPAAGELAGQQLVDAVNPLLGDGGAAEVLSAATALYGDRVTGDLGAGDRQTRAQRVRRYQFESQLPWLAQVWARKNGQVGPVWLLVERFTDLVLTADPNPWDEVDEEKHTPVAEFQVLWELSGCASVHLRIS